MLNPQEYLKHIREATDFIRSRGDSVVPSVGVILGSGLARSVPELERKTVIPYAEIPGFPRTTVAGHEGQLIFGLNAKKPVAILRGRFHYYEGHELSSIALPVRVLASLGVKTLVITAAVGSMRAGIKPGHMAVVKDHFNFTGHNPLRGFHQKDFGTMFPDLKDAYDPALRRLALKVCRKNKAPCSEGVYVATAGPSYETPAEVEAYRRLGGDVVGMSVVHEVIVARQIGVRVLTLSWVANMAAGMTQALLTHDEVLSLGERMSGRMRTVLSDILREVE